MAGPLTPGRFNRGPRKELWFKHGFSHDKLERAERVYGALNSIAKRKAHSSRDLTASKYEEHAEKYLDKIPGSEGWLRLSEEEKSALREWRKMSAGDREAFKGALRSGLGIKEGLSAEPQAASKPPPKTEALAQEPREMSHVADSKSHKTPTLLAPFFAPKSEPNPPPPAEAPLPSSAINDNEDRVG